MVGSINNNGCGCALNIANNEEGVGIEAAEFEPETSVVSTESCSVTYNECTSCEEEESEEEQCYPEEEEKICPKSDCPVSHTPTDAHYLAFVHFATAYFLRCVHKVNPVVVLLFLLLTRPQFALSISNFSASKEEYAYELDAPALDGNEYTASILYYWFLTFVVASVAFVICAPVVYAGIRAWHQDHLRRGANREFIDTGQRLRTTSISISSKCGQAAVPCEDDAASVQSEIEAAVPCDSHQAASAHSALWIKPRSQYRPPRRKKFIQDTPNGRKSPSAFVVLNPRRGYDRLPADSVILPNCVLATRLSVPTFCDDTIPIVHRQDCLGAHGCLVGPGYQLGDFELAPLNVSANAHVTSPAPETFETPCFSEVPVVRPFVYSEKADLTKDELQFFPRK